MKEQTIHQEYLNYIEIRKQYTNIFRKELKWIKKITKRQFCLSKLKSIFKHNKS